MHGPLPASADEVAAGVIAPADVGTLFSASHEMRVNAGSSDRSIVCVTEQASRSTEIMALAPAPMASARALRSEPAWQRRVATPSLAAVSRHSDDIVVDDGTQPCSSEHCPDGEAASAAVIGANAYQTPRRRGLERRASSPSSGQHCGSAVAGPLVSSSSMEPIVTVARQPFELGRYTHFDVRWYIRIGDNEAGTIQIRLWCNAEPAVGEMFLGGCVLGDPVPLPLAHSGWMFPGSRLVLVEHERRSVAFNSSSLSVYCPVCAVEFDIDRSGHLSYEEVAFGAVINGVPLLGQIAGSSEAFIVKCGR
jgi:hypothetical protein